MSCAYGIMSATDAQLALSLVPQGLPVTDIAAKLFATFRKAYGLFTRTNNENALKAQLKDNRTRIGRASEPGDMFVPAAPV